MPSTDIISTRPSWGRLLAVLLVIKLVLLVLDPTPMFFLGDSASYLHSALTGWVPPDRSYLYGRLFAPAIVVSGSLFSVVVIQTLTGLVTSALLVLILFRYCGVSFFRSAVAGVLFCIAPLQIIYERFILTETFTLFFFAAFLVGLFETVVFRRRLLWVLVVPLGVATVMMRTAMLPTITTLIIAGTLFFLFNAVHRPWFVCNNLPILLTVLLVLLGFWLMLSAGTKAQSRWDGYFWISTVAPLIQEDHLRQHQLDPKVFRDMPCQLNKLTDREQQRWLKGCLVSVMFDQYGDHTEAVAISKEIALSAIFDDPLGFLYNGLQTYWMYWDREVVLRAMKRDTGRSRPLGDDFERVLRENFGLVFADYQSMATLSRRYIESSLPWLKVLLITSFIFFLIILRHGRNTSFVEFTLLLAATAYTVSISLFVTDNVVRYLHPLEFLCVIAVFLLASSSRGGSVDAVGEK